MVFHGKNLAPIIVFCINITSNWFRGNGKCSWKALFYLLHYILEPKLYSLLTLYCLISFDGMFLCNFIIKRH